MSIRISYIHLKPDNGSIYIKGRIDIPDDVSCNYQGLTEKELRKLVSNKFFDDIEKLCSKFFNRTTEKIIYQIKRNNANL